MTCVFAVLDQHSQASDPCRWMTSSWKRWRAAIRGPFMVQLWFFIPLCPQGKDVVLMLYWSTCPHCQQLQPVYEASVRACFVPVG